MIYIKWLLLVIADLALLLTVPFVAPFVALFTRAMPQDQAPYTWGGWWGTYDNPPQGDEGYVAKRSPFPNETQGWKGYLNRVMWMLRNPMYGFAKLAGITYSPDLELTYVGDPNISDKDRRPGWYFAKLKNQTTGRMAGFEFYGVFPWSSTRNLRVRLGWKLMTDKFERYGFAQLVNTFNPFDGYGDS